MYEKKNLSPLNGREKTKQLSQTLRAYNSRMHETMLLKFGMWVEGICTTKIIVQQGSTELHMRENCGLVLPVNILTVWCAGLLGHMTHNCVS